MKETMKRIRGWSHDQMEGCKIIIIYRRDELNSFKDDSNIIPCLIYSLYVCKDVVVNTKRKFLEAMGEGSEGSWGEM